MMNPDDFEKRLQRLPLREIPSEWRENILRQAAPSRPPAPDPRPSFLSALLWPNPKAWVGLAAAWVLIFALHLNFRVNSPRLVTASASGERPMMMTLEDEQQTLAELIGNGPSSAADQPRRLAPTPHSERRRTTAEV